MNCKNCGYILEGENSYCPNCGSIVSNPTTPNQTIGNQVPPVPMPGFQVPGYQGVSHQSYSNQALPNQALPNQRMSYPPQYGMLPPPVPPHMQVHPKRNKALLPIFIVGYILFYLFLIVIIVMALVPYSEEVPVSEIDRLAEKYGLEEPDYSEVPFGGSDFGYSIDEAFYPNYDTLIQGRDLQAYEQKIEIVMENGIGFYLNDIVVNDLGDGTASVDANIDLASYSAENYLYLEDFMLLPMDRAGNALSDACSIEYIMDSNGNAVLTPMLLDTEEYQNYTISFIVPTDLSTFNVYGINYSTEGFTGPVYYIEMQVDE